MIIYPASLLPLGIPYWGGDDWSRPWIFPNTNQDPSTPDPQWTSLWPVRPSLVGQDITAANAWKLPATWVTPEPLLGSSGRRQIAGVTRDYGNNPIAGVTVGAYRAVDGVLECTAVSDSVGNYILWVNTAGNYFVAGFITGAPDREGVTDNNIAGV